MDDLRAILSFVNAAEARNFTVAARRLGVTPSGVSKSIARLETRFKVGLLNRTSRSVTLTPEGSAYYERCRAIVAQLEDAEQFLDRVRAEPSGLLRITLPLSVGRRHLARALPAFLARYPAIQLEASLSDRLVDLGEEGFDLAVRVGKPPDSRLIARQVAAGSLTTCAAPDYLKTYGVPRSPEDVLRHNCIRFASPNTRRPASWQFQREGRRFPVAASGNLVLDHAEALVEAALAGLGMIQISSYVTVDLIQRGALRPVLPRFQADAPGIFVMYPQNRHLTPRVRALVDFLVAWGAGLERSLPRP